MVQMNDVKMVYGNTEAAALNGISFTINEGEFVFLVGPSGSGKTTIIKLITGELSPTSGQITVNGFDMQGIKRRKLPKLRRTLGVIFQDFRLIDKMTVYENVAFAMRVVGASNKEIRRRVPQVLELVNSKLPVVTIDHVFNNRAAVVSDNVRGMEELVRYVYSKGHRRIAFIHGERTAVTENRLTGFYRACDALGLEIPEEYVREGVYHDPDRCAELTQELLRLPEPPTCILMPDDFSSIGGGNAIQRMGLRLPEDVSAAAYDGIQLASITSPAMTTYRQDTAALGKTAAAKLIELIEKPRTALVDRILIPGKLVEGGSVRAI